MMPCVTTIDASGCYFGPNTLMTTKIAAPSSRKWNSGSCSRRVANFMGILAAGLFRDRFFAGLAACRRDRPEQRSAEGSATERIADLCDRHQGQQDEHEHETPGRYVGPFV